MINQLSRYLPVLPLLAGVEDPILEVGCGAFGLGRWTSRPFVGCDRSFDDYGPASNDHARGMRPVRGDAARLPFRDRAFGAVVCLDTLEHLPVAARAQAVREICRVAHGPVVLAFPWGAGIAVWDRRFAAHLRKRKVPPPTWLLEHLAVDPPDPRVVMAELLACGRRVTVRRTAPAATHFLLMCAEAEPRIGRKLNRIAGRVACVLQGRPRHRLDPILARAGLALGRAAAWFSGTRRGYRAYLVGWPQRPAAEEAP